MFRIQFVSIILLLSVPAIGLSAEQKVVIPFDFESKFDDGRYGKIVGNMIWKKLDRDKKFIIPETMLDVRSTAEMISFYPNPDTKTSEMEKVVKDTFDAQIAIWGKMERVPGHQWEVYDFSLKCVDFSTKPPKTIYEVDDARTESVSEVPDLYVREMFMKLYGLVPDEKKTDPIAEKNWKENPNLLADGTFEKMDDGIPVGWSERAGQLREPFGKMVERTLDSEKPSNHVVKFTLDTPTAEGYGLMYYSNPFPVEEGATYRFQCRFKSSGPAVKVFIKCSDVIDSKFNPTTTGWQEGFEEKFGSQTREVYRSQQNLSGPKDKWNTHTEDFTPQHTRYSPKFGRIMLYAYIVPGTVEFDDVVVKRIQPAPTDYAKKKDSLKHSLGTDVSLDEMRGR